MRRTEVFAKKEPTVRNIDKIENQRIERRENQAKQRYQRDQIKSKHDVNDSQWEFAEMYVYYFPLPVLNNFQDRRVAR